MQPGDVIAILSNGGFGGIYEKLPQRLKRQGRVHGSIEATDKTPIKAPSRA
jgi:hypothetical protein